MPHELTPDEIHERARPVLESVCDLIDVERNVVEIQGHKVLALQLWFSPVMRDEPIYSLHLIVDPEGALNVHLLSQEQFDEHFTNNHTQEPTDG